MADLIYWVWLSSALGEPSKVREILEHFGTVENFYNANILDWRQSEIFSQNEIKLLEEQSLSHAEEIVEICEKNNWQIIPYSAENYPERLKNIQNPPAVLFVDGVFPNVDEKVLVGIVGTRKASDYALRCAEVMACGICEGGGIVVSGGAIGVDSAAHRGAISCGGKTLAVLGCGFGTGYLKSNERLRNEIKERGALVTPFTPHTGATRYNFPLRNRIISGLSLAVLVVEAALKSGSLITAGTAISQGKDLYAVPCSILESKYAGTNKLISDGANIAINPVDILFPYAEEYGLDLTDLKTSAEIFAAMRGQAKNANARIDEENITFENLTKTREKRAKNRDKAIELGGNAKAVYDALTDDFQTIGEIVEKCALPLPAVLSALTILEINNIAVNAGGKRYRLS